MPTTDDMPDQPADSPRLDDCTTVALITPSRGCMAAVRVALVRTDRMPRLLNDYHAMCGAGGVDVALVWPSTDDELGGSFRNVTRDRLDDLAKLLDRYDERLDNGPHEPRRAPEGQS